jgi:hypothetical protein
MDDLERHLRAVVEAEEDAPERVELVALRRIVRLRAAQRQVGDEERIPVRALALLEDDGDRILEGKPGARDEADREDVGRQAPDGPDALDEGLGDPVVVEIDLLDARDLREGDVRVLEAGDAPVGHGALAERRGHPLGRHRRRDRRRHRGRRLRGSGSGLRRGGGLCARRRGREHAPRGERGRAEANPSELSGHGV